jgi:uncharacterized membrane protein YkoI
MTRTRPLPLLAVLAALAVAGLPVSDSAAANGHRERGGDRTMAEQRSVSLDEAVAQAERRYKARAVRAEEKRHGDRIEYRIRLLGDDGRVFEVRIDAATGRES